MKTLLKAASAAALLAATATGVSAPAAAQVNGVATSDINLAVIRSQAFGNGYQQINTQYQAQMTTIGQRQQQRQQLVQSFDANGDGQLDQTEQAATQDPNNTTVQQIQAIDRELQQLQTPIDLARVYVVQQVAQRYQAALQNVITANNIQFMITPEALIHAAPAADVTAQVTAQLDTALPAATITPPAGYQPSEAAVALYQQIQQILLRSAIERQQQQAGQQPAAQSGR